MGRSKFVEEATVEELEAQLKKLQELNLKPVMLTDIDLGPLKAECHIYINTIAEGKLVDEDTKQGIFECAITTFFGKDIWKWVNDRQ
jgi:hypothetical protein